MTSTTIKVDEALRNFLCDEADEGETLQDVILRLCDLEIEETDSDEDPDSGDEE